MAEQKPLSDRAKLRLKIAAALLRSGGKKLNFPREEFYEQIQKVLAELPKEDQTELKGLVDWVEAYDRAEHPAQPGGRQVPTSAKGS